MRILRLQARGFRRHSALDLPLAPGLTVIRGPNEAGKSTIGRMIELALTRKVTSTSADLDALRPWSADPDDPDARPWVALEFVEDDLDGPVHGRLEKSFRGAKGTVSLRIGSAETTDPALADERLAELTGIPTERFFRSTASVHHHEVADLDGDEAALRDRLQASISGGGQGSSAARKRLERAIRELTSRGDKNPGRLKSAENAVEQVRLAVENGDRQLEQLQRDREALSLAREERASVEADLGERRAMLERARQADRLRTEGIAAGERYERYRKAVAASEELARLEARHPAHVPLAALRTMVEQLRRIDARLDTLTEILTGEAGVTFAPSSAAPGRAIRAIGRLLVLVGAVVIALGLAASLGLLETLAGGADQLPISRDTLDLLGRVGPTAGGVVALVGFVLQIVGWWVGREWRAEAELRTTEVNRRLRGRSQFEGEFRELAEERKGILGALGQRDLAAAEAILTAETEHVAAVQQVAAGLAGLVGNEPREGLAEVRDAAALEVERKRSALQALGPIAEEARARERLEAEMIELEAALERVRDAEAAARARVDANTVDAEQVAGESERLAAWREQLAFLQRRGRVLALALDGLERAERATLRTATRYLERHMVSDLSDATAGRYRRVRVDDRTLGIEVWAPERHGWVSASELSRGTIDLVYLAARLGLVRLVTGGRRPPLVLDDPFVTFDDERASRAIDLLRALVPDHQVLYLTTSDRYDAKADAVVELARPDAVDDGREEEPAPEAPVPEAPVPEVPAAVPASEVAPADEREAQGDAPETDRAQAGEPEADQAPVPEAVAAPSDPPASP